MFRLLSANKILVSSEKRRNSQLLDFGGAIYVTKRDEILKDFGGAIYVTNLEQEEKVA